MTTGREGIPGALVVPEPLKREPEVPPRAAVRGVLLDHALELEACLRRLPGLQVREGEVDPRLERLGVELDQALVDGDGARVEPEPKVDDAEEILPLGSLGWSERACSSSALASWTRLSWSSSLPR